VREPLVPLIVSGKVPLSVVVLVLTVMVVELEVVTESGLKMARAVDRLQSMTGVVQPCTPAAVSPTGEVWLPIESRNGVAPGDLKIRPFCDPLCAVRRFHELTGRVGLVTLCSIHCNPSPS